MEQLEEFPFLVGQKVESKSNIKGYRGAWFRCEIKDLHLRRGEIWCAMQYSDFPDEKVSSTKAYQQELTGRKRRVLMLRPSYPKICWGFDNFGITDSVGAVVVINGDWEVGDLVDWFSDGCYWGAKIVAVTNKDFVQIELPSPPIGEGGRYEAAVKDIRPLLDWSLEHLWTVPGCKLYSNHQSEGLGINYIPAGLTESADQFEIAKKEHFFIARQEPLKTTVIRGPKFNMDQEVRLKRKGTVLESDHMPGVSNVPELGYSNNSYKFGDIIDAVTESTYFTASTTPLMGQSRDIPAINVASASFGNLTSHMGNNTGIFSHISRMDNVVIENDTAFQSTFSFLSKKDQVNCPLAECSGEHLLAVKSSVQDKKGRDCEEKIDQIGRLRGSRYIELEPSLLQVDEYESSQQGERHLFQMEDRIGAMDSDMKHFFMNSGQEIHSSRICNQPAGGVFDQNVDNLVGEGKYLDVDEASIGSSVMTLEELLSRVVWLKGVLQLGLKGWSQERNRKKWTLCEQEAQPAGNFEQDGKFASIHQVSDKAMLDGITGSPA